MSDEPSFQRRLTVSIVAIVGVSLVACSLIVYASFVRRVWRDFDARLAQDADAIATLQFLPYPFRFRSEG